MPPPPVRSNCRDRREREAIARRVNAIAAVTAVSAGRRGGCGSAARLTRIAAPTATPAAIVISGISRYTATPTHDEMTFPPPRPGFASGLDGTRTPATPTRRRCDDQRETMRVAANAVTRSSARCRSSRPGNDQPVGEVGDGQQRFEKSCSSCVDHRRRSNAPRPPQPPHVDGEADNRKPPVRARPRDRDAGGGVANTVRDGTAKGELGDRAHRKRTVEHSPAGEYAARPNHCNRHTQPSASHTGPSGEQSAG